MAIRYHPVKNHDASCTCTWSQTNSGIIDINNECILHGASRDAIEFRDHMWKEAARKNIDVERVNNSLLLKHQKYVFMGQRKDVTQDVVPEKRYTPIARFR